MIEDKFKLLSSPLVIQPKLDSIIEAFVEFYGEDKRANVENKLRNTLILKFCNNDNLAQIITDIEEILFREVFNPPERFFYYFNPDEVIRVFENTEENYVYITDDIKNICFDGEQELETIIDNYRKGMYPKFNEYVQKFKELNQKLLPYKEQYKKEEKRISEIDDKYYKILVEEFSYLFNEEELDDFRKYNITSGRIRLYLDTSLNSTPHAFSSKTEELLHDPKTSSWKKTSIEGDRILFLKKHGFDLATEDDLFNEPSYEEYLNNPECAEFVEKIKLLIEKIEKRKQELNKLRVEEIVYGLEDYKQCTKYIEERKYVNKNDALGPFVYQSPVSCCEMNFVQNGQYYIPNQLILINAGMGALELTIIHELNHAYEAHVLQVNEKGSVSITGWDIETSEFKDKKEAEQLEYSGITRQYELMSEYINDRIAEDILKIMKNKGQYILIENENKGSMSSYRYVDFLLEEFYQSFKPIIIESRSYGNIELIYNKLGRENFEALNNLVNKYYEIFGFGFAGREAVVDWWNNTPNQNKDKIVELAKERDIIIEQMKEHLLNVEQTL